MAKSYASINPSDGTIRTVQPFDEAFLDSVRAMKRIRAADARRTINARLKLGADQWVNLTVFAVSDYDDIRVNKIRPQRGSWPPPEREILIERSALPLIGAEIGDWILIETPDDKQRRLRVAGTVHDLAQLPAQIDNTPYGYISFDTVEWFGLPYGFNELYVIVEKPEPATLNIKEYNRQIVNSVKEKAEESGLTIPMSMTAEPGQLPLDDFLQAILLVMGTLGVLSLFLSAFLIINTITALLAQQKRQIGVMKAIGASAPQIIGMYLSMVLSYGVLALMLAAPLSRVGARFLSQEMAGMFNFDLPDPHMPSQVVFLQILVSLAVPLLASLLPLLSNLRITAADAMSVFRAGMGKNGVGLVGCLLSGPRIWATRQFLMRPWLYSIRNTFRSQGRLALTLITLTMASAIFVSVFSVRAALMRSIDDLLQMWNYDVMLVFERPYRREKIIGEAFQIPQVTQVDTEIQLPARRVRPDGNEGGMLYLFAPRASSELFLSPRIVEGRWLLPEDENALVLSTNALQEEPDIRLGDEVVLKIEGQEQSWRVVGFSMGFMLPMAYANYPFVANITGRTGRADTVLVDIQAQTPEDFNRVSTTLETHFERKGIRVGSAVTVADERAEANVVYGIVITLMLMMAALLAVVGALGLMGTMSINVLERTREIGVMRAIGAPNRSVAQVFILEGITIGIISWMLGVCLAIPLSRVISDTLGMVLAGAPMTFVFSMSGVVLWLVLVVLLSAVASYLPARSASRLTVREVLAYE
jgi:putative ABC transport system permease protein